MTAFLRMKIRRSISYGIAAAALLGVALGMPHWIPWEYRTVTSWAAGVFAAAAAYCFVCEVRPGCWIQRAVNGRSTKAITPLVVILAVVVPFSELGYPTSLAWPALGLSQLGIPHTWPVVVVMIPALLVYGCLQCRNKPWWQIIVTSLVGSLSYCLAALAFLAFASVPGPSIAHQGAALDPEKVTAFRRAYEEGYREAMVGQFRSYCFRPEEETRGFYEGSREGCVIWYRMLGLPLPEHIQRMIVRSAAIDGVDLRPKSSPETNRAPAPR